MQQELRILLLEDVAEDAELLRHELQRWRFRFNLKCVESKEAFVHQLEVFKPDFIFSDYSLPGFDGISALRLAKELTPEVPFILVTGSMSEEVAVECMKAGATDYILKGHISRLEHAINNALERRRTQEERRKAEQAQQLAEEKYRGIFENSSAGIFQCSPEGKFLSINPALARSFGYDSPGEMIDQVQDIGQELYVDSKGRERFKKLLETHGHVQGFEAELYRRDGTSFWVLINARLVRDSGGKILYYEGSSVDVTDRKLSEATLRENERRWRTMLDNMQLAVINLDLQGSVEYANPFFFRLTGYTGDEVRKKDWFANFIPEAERAQAQKAFAEMIKTQNELHLQSALITKSGEKRLIAWNHTILRSPRGRVTGVLSIGENITERIMLETQLRHAQKMEAVGRLAGGIAHDFNNLLTAINGYSSLLLGEMSEQDPGRHEILEIRQAGQRAADLTRQLLAFSRKQVLQVKTIDLNALIRDVSSMIRRLIGEDIEMQMVLAPNLGRIKGDPGQIEQVIMNLAVNSRDAMPLGGRLVLETANEERNTKEMPAHSDLQPGAYVRFSISDTGTGMDPEVLPNIFEPFFTTKEQGKGTGLGLSTVYGIVKQSGGDIEVESEPGMGAKFSIWLPRAEEEKTNIGPRPEPTRTNMQGTETILFAEDDEAVRLLVSKVLERSGYKVLEARGASEAILIAQRHPDPIHLLITDLVMPKMNGHDLAGQLRLRRPEIKVLYISGYTDNMAMRKEIVEQQLPFVQKPFLPNVLLNKIRDLLDTRKEPTPNQGAAEPVSRKPVQQ